MVQISQVLWKVYLLRASLSLYSRSSQTTGAFHPYSAYPLKEFLYPRHSVYRARGVFNRPPETVCKKPGSIRNAQSYAEEWAFLWALQKPPSARECPLSCPAVIWGSLIGSLAWLCTTSREPAHTQSKKRFKIQYLRAWLKSGDTIYEVNVGQNMRSKNAVTLREKTRQFPYSFRPTPDPCQYVNLQPGSPKPEIPRSSGLTESGWTRMGPERISQVIQRHSQVCNHYVSSQICYTLKSPRELWTFLMPNLCPSSPNH